MKEEREPFSAETRDNFSSFFPIFSSQQFPLGNLVLKRIGFICCHTRITCYKKHLLRKKTVFLTKDIVCTIGRVLSAEKCTVHFREDAQNFCARTEGSNEAWAKTKVARWQNLIPSFPWIAPGWRALGRNPRKGRDQILQCSVTEPYSRSPMGQTHTILKIWL